MREIMLRRYECSICKHQYKTSAEALSCEEQPFRNEKPVEVGDEVRITNGGGSGYIAIVENTLIAEKYWGQGSWRLYWHTVLVCVKIKEGQGSLPGSRWLTLDDYYKIETIEKGKG